MHTNAFIMDSLPVAGKNSFLICPVSNFVILLFRLLPSSRLLRGVTACRELQQSLCWFSHCRASSAFDLWCYAAGVRSGKLLHLLERMQRSELV